MDKKGVLYYLGNFFIIMSLVGFVYIAYPVILIYFFPPSPPLQTQLIRDGFYLSIPKIHAYSEVVANVDPWKESVYKEALKKGVAHAKGTYLPGEDKTIFLFAHSSGSPWEITHQNTVFLRLGELEKNDLVLIDYKKKRYQYTIYDKKEVSPTDTDYLKNIDKDIVILQTCTPIGTSLKRLLIFAKES
jgi:LPXTG-site transpeptidase (sortase) family protein